MLCLTLLSCKMMYVWSLYIVNIVSHAYTQKCIQDQPNDLEIHKQKIQLQRQTEDARSPFGSYSVKFEGKKEPKDSTVFLLANTNPLQQVLQYWVCQSTCRVCISLSFYCIVYLLLPLCFFVDLSLSLFVLPLFRLSFLPNPLSFLSFSQTFSPCHSDSISLFGSLRDSFPPPDLLSDSFFAFLSNH